MNTKCPQCDTVYNVTEAHIGRKVKCKSCSAALVVTEAGLALQAPATAPPPPPAAPAFAFNAGEDDPPAEERPRRGARGKSSRREEPDDDAPEDDPPSRSRGRKAKAPSNFKEYLTFRKMIVPVIIQIIFWITVVFMLLGALGVAGGSLFSGSAMAIVAAIIGLLIAIPSGILLARIYCEMIIVLFRVLDALQDIKQLLERQSTGSGPPADDV